MKRKILVKGKSAGMFYLERIDSTLVTSLIKYKI